MIKGIGVDIVSIVRIGKVVEKHGERFLRKAFHPKEIASYEAKSKEAGTPAYQYLSARWAAKESLFKALGGSYRIPFPQVKITPNARGQPIMVAEGKAKEMIAKFGAKEILVSISHDTDYAIANVLIQ